MKQLKSILALLLTLSLLLALGLTAYAEGETTYTLTITPKATDKGTHTYEAYQIFTGTLAVKDNKKILSDIAWGANVDKDNETKMTALAEAINALDPTNLTGEAALTAASTASAFADAIAGLNATADGETAQAVAEAFAGVLKGDPAGTGACNLGDTDETNNNAEISGLAAGYYLVKDRDSTLADAHSAYTRYILQVLGDTELGAKNEVPSVDKKIQEGDTQVSANTASIGDSISYVISSKVPDMTGYNNKYYFVLNDTMSKGLTFNNDVAVKINGTALGTDAYTVTCSTDATTGVTTLKIVLKNFIQYNTDTYKGKDITVTYSATLNEKAELGPAGNVNDCRHRGVGDDYRLWMVAQLREPRAEEAARSLVAPRIARRDPLVVVSESARTRETRTRRKPRSGVGKYRRSVHNELRKRARPSRERRDCLSTADGKRVVG